MKTCDHCKDKGTNYDCPCWYEGYAMGGAEAGFNKVELLKEILALPVMNEEMVLNKVGHNITSQGKAKPEKIRNDLRHDIRFVLLKKIKEFKSEH